MTLFLGKEMVIPNPLPNLVNFCLFVTAAAARESQTRLRQNHSWLEGEHIGAKKLLIDGVSMVVCGQIWSKKATDGPVDA